MHNWILLKKRLKQRKLEKLNISVHSVSSNVDKKNFSEAHEEKAKYVPAVGRKPEEETIMDVCEQKVNPLVPGMGRTALSSRRGAILTVCGGYSPAIC